MKKHMTLFLVVAVAAVILYFLFGQSTMEGTSQTNAQINTSVAQAEGGVIS